MQPFWPWLIALDDERLNSVREAMSEHWGRTSLLPILFLIVVFTVLFVALWLWERSQDSTGRRIRPVATFRHLATVVGLSRPDQRLLIRIARREQLPSPLVLLLSRQALHDGGRRFASSLSPWQRRRVHQRVGDLLRSVFSESSPSSNHHIPAPSGESVRAAGN